jgi:hypothetical protein
VLTGRGVDIIIIDDPLKLEEAVSKPQLSPPTIAVEFHNIAVLGVAMNQGIGSGVQSREILLPRQSASPDAVRPKRMRAIAMVRDTAMVDGPGTAQGRCAEALAGVLEVSAPDIRVRTT